VNLLLTGSRGFIGQRLTELLRLEQHSVAEFAGDIRDEHSYPVATSCDAIIHLAAVIPHRAEVAAQDFEQVNHNATRQLVQRFPAAHFVFASTADVKRTPLTLYAHSKLAAEAPVRSASSHCIVRLPSVFGPHQRQTSKLIPTLLRHHVLGTPPPPHLTNETREYLWVGDAAAAFSGALRQQGTIDVEGVRISNQSLAALITAAATGFLPTDLPAAHQRMFGHLQECAAALRTGRTGPNFPQPS
jgi:nucleoside-diphosphate-sugar epimerase